jgi:hypothetical protein
MVSAQTEAEWRQAMASVHPDAGGDMEQFIALNNARDEWRKAQPRICRQCGVKPLHARQDNYCGKHCTMLALAIRRSKPKQLKRAARLVVG